MAKKIATYIINFLLIITIFLLITVMILSSTILNKQYTKNILEKKDYYERTYYGIENDFKNHTMQSGLEDSIVENLYDKDKVKNDINMVIETIYNNKELNIDTESIKKTLDDRINAILEENNRKPGTEEQEAINIFEDAITDTYINGITYSEEAVQQLGKTIARILPIVSYIKIALGAVAIMLAIAIIFINKNAKESIKTFGIALLTTGLLNIAIKILIGDRVHNVLVLNLTFSQSLIELINSVVSKFFIIGIIISIIGVALTIILNINKKQPIE